jgi:hypothetical protein
MPDHSGSFSEYYMNEISKTCIYIEKMANHVSVEFSKKTLPISSIIKPRSNDASLFLDKCDQESIYETVYIVL